MIRRFAESIVGKAPLAWQKSACGRRANYHLPGERIPTPKDIFRPAPAISAPSSPHLTGSSPHLGGSSLDLDGRRNVGWCLLSDWFPIGKADVECCVMESAP